MGALKSKSKRQTRVKRASFGITDLLVWLISGDFERAKNAYDCGDLSYNTVKLAMNRLREEGRHDLVGRLHSAGIRVGLGSGGSRTTADIGEAYMRKAQSRRINDSMSASIKVSLTPYVDIMNEDQRVKVFYHPDRVEIFVRPKNGA